MQIVSGAHVAEKSVYRIAKVRNREIGRFAQALLVAAFNEDRSTTCGARTIDIAPPVAADVGLVGDHNEEKFRCLQSRAAVLSVVVEFEILDAGWRMGSPVADDGPVEHTIAI